MFKYLVDKTEKLQTVMSVTQLTNNTALVVCFLLGNSTASEAHMPTFRNPVSVPSSLAGRRVSIGVCPHAYLLVKTEQSVPKRCQINFRRRGITQKKAYNIYNTAKFRNQERCIRSEIHSQKDNKMGEIFFKHVSSILDYKFTFLTNFCTE
jgi:hypothetical protein